MAWLQPQPTRERPDTFMQLESSFAMSRVSQSQIRLCGMGTQREQRMSFVVSVSCSVASNAIAIGLCGALYTVYKPDLLRTNPPSVKGSDVNIRNYRFF